MPNATEFGHDTEASEVCWKRMIYATPAVEPSSQRIAYSKCHGGYRSCQSHTPRVWCAFPTALWCWARSGVNVTPVFRVHLHPRAWEVGAFFLFDPPTVCCVEPALEKLDGEGLRNQMFGDYLALRCAAGVVPPPHSLSCQGQGAGRKPHRTCGLMSSSKYPPAIFFVSMERGARQPPSPIKCRAARARARRSTHE